MSRRNQISFGDLLRATESLGSETLSMRRAVAALLGFEFSEETTAKTKSRIAQGLSADASEAGKLTRQATPSHNAEQEKPDARGKADAPLDGAHDNAWVESLPPKSLRMPQWYDEVQPLSDWSDEEEEAPPPLDPLFNPGWMRALLQAVLSVTDENGPVDVERAVEQLGQAGPLRHYPRLPYLRLADGVDVLIDLNETMRPFEQDQHQLLSDIRRVMSAQLVNELYFTICPTRGVGESSARPLRDYSPPRPGTPVLVLTDLGASWKDFDIEQARPEEWLSFAGLLRRANCPLVALVPYPLARVSVALRRAMTVITWDRTTTTGMVRRLRRDADRRLLG
jgi:hypothetical protein